ncbi:MoaD/ThiS family protein [Microbacterium protaetiae]|uniref:Molybdopterin synthase sulfur carrier subunit n=1 Tax=Microbacterium protaetiae TaxID=2509458 RepID=A0A4P6EGH5_9MICO|nr:MoaD/ThiS family protein [Microbacterium protaetiae]QAY60543.1 MoaD/ThiS family protein [Microbacterium protaetiae]
MTQVRFFAAAEEAAGAAERFIEASHLGALRATLSAQFPALAAILPKCSVLVDGARVDDSEPLPAGAVVDVLPPFAGG